jgi:hypothetical protein
VTHAEHAEKHRHVDEQPTHLFDLITMHVPLDQVRKIVRQMSERVQFNGLTEAASAGAAIQSMDAAFDELEVLRREKAAREAEASRPAEPAPATRKSK